jgi:LAO/AO transport system kinase
MSDPTSLVERLRGGDRRALARLISVVEQGGEAARATARLTFALSNDAATIGCTGAPGAGKSTLTSQLITAMRQRGERVAVLAVDPSSPFSGGAILGDRVRMQDHALDPGVFIRSMATRGHLGGLALAVPEAIRVLDAAGWPVVLVETVGVGQVEVEVASTCDTTIVVVNPGWGDSVQANKAGLLEIADVFVINKADRPGVAETRRDLEQMMALSGPLLWRPPILSVAAVKGEGVAELLEALDQHRAHLIGSGELLRRRQARLEQELRRIVTGQVMDALDQARRGPVLADLLARRIDPYAAAAVLLEEVVRELTTAHGADDEQLGFRRGS